jgi:hypothetical protein
VPVSVLDVNGAVWTGGDTEAIEIAAGMIDDSLPRGERHGPVRADLDTLSGTAAFVDINDNFHRHTSLIGYPCSLASASVMFAP